MLSRDTYKLSDIEFKTPQISLHLKSTKIWPCENKALDSNHNSYWPFDGVIPLSTQVSRQSSIHAGSWI